MRDLHAGCWGSLHTMWRLVLPTCDTACFWTGYLVLTASDLQENWNPVLNLYENSEFVELGRLHPLQRSSQNFGTKQRALWHFSLHCMRRRIIDIIACPRKDYGYFHCHFGTPERKIVCFWFGHDARLACGLLSCPTSV